MVCRILKFFLTSQNHIIYVRYSKSSKAAHLRDSISKALAESHSRRRVRSAFDAAAAIFFIVAAIIFIQGGGGGRGPALVGTPLLHQRLPLVPLLHQRLPRCYFLLLLPFLSLPFFFSFVLFLRRRERDSTGGWIPNLRESESQSPLHLPSLHLFQLILRNSKVNTFE